MRLEHLLLSERDISAALGTNVLVQPVQGVGTAGDLGSLLARAAVESAFRSYSGQVLGDGTETPLAIGSMGLLFDTPELATRMFDGVAGAAHLRTRIDSCAVAVETATGANGLVSYWSYLHLGRALVILTMDTIDPQAVSMSDFRVVVTAAAELLERSIAV